MYTLFIDTHGDKLILAIIADNDIEVIEKEDSKSISEITIPCLIDLLNKKNASLTDINQIIVINGPGSFTGVRLGVTIAKTIAYSLNIKIKTITSLEAYGISDNNTYDLITVNDSKGVYSARLNDQKFYDFTYKKNSDFQEYIENNNYTISTNKRLNYEKILNYLKDKDYNDPFQVNPYYIKEIDVK